jgi:hypothetical protein
VLPVAGVTVSQGVFVLVVTPKFSELGDPLTGMVWAAGAVPPATCVNVRAVVGAEIVPGCTTSWTAMTAGLLPAPGEVTVMFPL